MTIHWEYLIVALCLISFGAMYYLCESAPEAYEDETGFHYGKPK